MAYMQYSNWVRSINFNVIRCAELPIELRIRVATRFNRQFRLSFFFFLLKCTLLTSCFLPFFFFFCVSWRRVKTSCAAVSRCVNECSVGGVYVSLHCTFQPSSQLIARCRWKVGTSYPVATEQSTHQNTQNKQKRPHTMPMLTPSNRQRHVYTPDQAVLSSNHLLNQDRESQSRLPLLLLCFCSHWSEM